MAAAAWQLARLPADAILATERLPDHDHEVLVWVSDEEVSIYHCPTVAALRSGEWWAGLPGSWIDLRAKRWTVTHWKEIW